MLGASLWLHERHHAKCVCNDDPAFTATWCQELFLKDADQICRERQQKRESHRMQMDREREHRAQREMRDRDRDHTRDRRRDRDRDRDRDLDIRPRQRAYMDSYKAEPIVVPSAPR